MSATRIHTPGRRITERLFKNFKKINSDVPIHAFFIYSSFIESTRASQSKIARPSRIEYSKVK